MKKYCIATPISSDALSFFGKDTKDADKEDVRQATEVCEENELFMIHT